MRILLLAFIACMTVWGQGRPAAAAQKAAMEKLKFMIGTWVGESVTTLANGKQEAMKYTEVVQFKLDGTVVTIEETGQDTGGKTVFSALGVISYSAGSGTYLARAWNHAGTYVETSMKVLDRGFEWRTTQGKAFIIDRMSLDDQGRWVENLEVTDLGGRTLQTVKLTLTKKE